MTALIVIISIFGFIFLLLCVSLTVYVKIDDEVCIAVGALGYKKAIDLGGDSEEIQKPKNKKEKKKKTDKADKIAEKVTDKKANEKSFSETVDFAVSLMKAVVPGSVKLLRKMRFTAVRIFITVASDDASQTAVHYGEMNTGVYTLLGALRSICSLKLKSCEIVPDFVREKSLYNISFKVKLRLINILISGVAILFKMVKVFLEEKATINSKQKEKQKIKAGNTTK